MLIFNVSLYWNLPRELRFITSKSHPILFNPMAEGEEESSGREAMDEEAEQVLREAEAVARWKTRPFYIS